MVLFILLIISMMLMGCGAGSGKDNADREAKIQKYCDSVKAQADPYFALLTEEALGNAADEISYGFQNADTDFLNSEPRTITELLSGAYPVLSVGLSRESGSYNDDEIRAVIKKACEKGIIVDLYFNYNDYCLYKIRHDGVNIDVTTAKDGGMMHEMIEYDLSE